MGELRRGPCRGTASHRRGSVGPGGRPGLGVRVAACTGLRVPRRDAARIRSDAHFSRARVRSREGSEERARHRAQAARRPCPLRALRLSSAPPPPPLEPGAPPLAILVDYDGTIAQTDVSDALMADFVTA